MNNIKNGFTNIYGMKFDNIRDIHFDKKSDLMNNLGTFVAETDNSFSDDSANNGVYIYQTYYDKNTALRIYKEFADYGFNGNRDDRLISELQRRQKDIKLTRFPTGVVTVENRIIGQEIPYYQNYITLSHVNTKIKKEPTYFYLKILEILKEMYDNGIVYSDTHGKNFMVDITNLSVKLIDFDYTYMAFDSNCKYLYKNMINNLKDMLIKLNKLYEIEFSNDFKTTQTLEEINECVKEKHYELSK